MNYSEEESLGKVYDGRLMKRLLAFLLPYKKWVVLAIVLLIMGAAAQLATPYLVKIAIDQYIVPNKLAGFKWLALIYISIIVVQFIFSYGRIYMTQWIGQKIMYDIRMKIFSHLQELPLSFFDRTPVGRLVTRTTNDVEALNNLLSSGVVAVFGDIFMLFGIIIIMLNLNWQLALITFTVLPLIFYATFLFRIKVRASFRKVRTRIAKINSYLQENITGMPIVQIFNREQRNFDHFDRLNKDHLDAHLQTIHYFAIFFPTVELFSAVSLGLILWYGGLQTFQGALTLGVVVAFIQYAQRFFQPIRDLSEKYNILQSAMAASERIFKLLDESPQIQESEQWVSLQSLKGAIEFKNVWFAYKKDDFVLRDVSFKIEPGEKVAIVGATGAGKTTIINLIARMYEPTKGQVLVDGINICDLKLSDLRRRIRMVLQDVFIFSGSAEYNIRLGNKDITEEQVIKAAKDVNAHQFITKFKHGYDQILNERGSNLSVGQKQLLSFARALAFDPEILILDEATSSVDTETELLIRKAINKLMVGRTSVIIAHRLSTIQNVDWIIVLHKGKIREVGTHAELLAKKEFYYRLYQLQYTTEPSEAMN